MGLGCVRACCLYSKFKQFFTHDFCIERKQRPNYMEKMFPLIKWVSCYCGKLNYKYGLFDNIILSKLKEKFT